MTNVRVERDGWWLDVSAFPDLLWARLRVFSDGTAEVFDLDGKVSRFPTEVAARDWLSEDEYESVESVDEEDLRYGGLVRDDLRPPSGSGDTELVGRMLVRRNPSPPRSAG
jgi:hypothetical protein